jgi:hypothetical protein
VREYAQGEYVVGEYVWRGIYVCCKREYGVTRARRKKENMVLGIEFLEGSCLRGDIVWEYAKGENGVGD